MNLSPDKAIVQNVIADPPIMNENLLFFVLKTASKPLVELCQKNFWLNLQLHKNTAYSRAKKKNF